MANTTSQRAGRAFHNCNNYASPNTKVLGWFGEAELYLFGNLIASKGWIGIKVSFSGWVTRTTCDRLNGVIEASGGGSSRFTIQQGLPYYDGKRIASRDWIII